MKIPTYQEIENIANNNGIMLMEGYSGVPPYQIDISNSPNSLEKFISLSKSYGRTVIFFNTTIYDRETLESYLIDLNLITEITYGEVSKEIKRKAENHNQLLLGLPIDSPASIELFIYADGCLFSLEFNEDWVKIIDEPENVIKLICSDHQDEIFAYRERKRDLQTRILEELGQKLISDATFKYCTTKDARLRRAVELIESSNLDFRMTRLEIQGWVDLLWAQFKEKK